MYIPNDIQDKNAIVAKGYISKENAVGHLKDFHNM